MVVRVERGGVIDTPGTPCHLFILYPFGYKIRIRTFLVDSCVVLVVVVPLSRVLLIHYHWYRGGMSLRRTPRHMKLLVVAVHTLAKLEGK